MGIFSGIMIPIHITSNNNNSNPFQLLNVLVVLVTVIDEHELLCGSGRVREELHLRHIWYKSETECAFIVILK